MDVNAWAIARRGSGGKEEFYQDEAPGSDEPRWTTNPDECVAMFEQYVLEGIREELQSRGVTGTYITTVVILHD